MGLRRSLLIVSVLMLVVALAACGGGSTNSTGSTSAVASGNGQTLGISGKDIAFIETAVTADAGKPISVNFKNTGALEHSIIFDLPPAGDKAGDVGIPKDWANSLRGIAPGKTETLQLPALEPGTYKYYCHVPGHETMVGSLTVK